MPPERPHANRWLAPHAVLIGLTPLIPVPFVDDAAETWLWHSLVQALARAHDVVLHDDEIRALAASREARGMFGRATRGLVMVPMKRFVRKAFFALEGKRVVDLTTRAYCIGYLLDLAFSRGWHLPKGRAADLRAAAERACREVGTSPVEQAVAHAYEHSKRAVATTVYTIARKRPWAQRRTKESDASTSAEAKDVGKSVDREVDAVPVAYFEKLTRAFQDALDGVVS